MVCIRYIYFQHVYYSISVKYISFLLGIVQTAFFYSVMCAVLPSTCNLNSAKKQDVLLARDICAITPVVSLVFDRCHGNACSFRPKQMRI